MQTGVIKLHEEHKIVHNELQVHDTRRCGSPDLFINPRHARVRLQISSRHGIVPTFETGGYVRDSDPHIRKPNTRVSLPLLTGEIKTDLEKQVYNEALTFNPHRNERISNFASTVNIQHLASDILTPPLSNEDNSFEHNLDKRVEEIIIDLDDEIELEERSTNPHGGGSPSYAPNEDIRVSEEDQRVFFNKRQKLAKIKTEARRLQDRQYVSQVRQLKEKAAELKRMSSGTTNEVCHGFNLQVNTSNIIPRKSNVVLEKTSTVRSQKRQDTVFAQKPSKSRLSSTHLREGVSNINFASSSPNNILDSYSTTFQTGQSISCQQSPSSPSVDFFNNLIVSACSSVQKQTERDEQKKKEMDRRLLQSNSALPSDVLVNRVESIVDRYVGESSLVAFALENPQSTNKKTSEEQFSGRQELFTRDSSNSPPYQATTPPRLEELENIRSGIPGINQNQTNSNVEVVCLSSDDDEFGENIVTNKQIDYSRGEKKKILNSRTTYLHSNTSSNRDNDDVDVITLDDDY